MAEDQCELNEKGEPSSTIILKIKKRNHLQFDDTLINDAEIRIEKQVRSTF